MPTDNLRRGALYIVISSVLFALMGAMIKRVAAELPNEMIVFFRSAIGLLALTPLVIQRGGLPAVRTKRFGGHLWRSLLGMGSMYCYFYAIAHMPLGEAVLLNYSAPLFIPFVAWLMLREHASRRLIGAIALGFFGVALILKPGWSLFTPISLVGLASGVLTAAAMVGVRGLARSEPSWRIVFYFSSICTVFSAVPLLWAWRAPPAHLWLFLLGIGACATVAQLFMTRGYSLAPAGQVGPFTYVTIIFAALFGWGFWSEIPDWASALGAVIVCVAGALTLRYESSRVTPIGTPPPPA